MWNRPWVRSAAAATLCGPLLAALISAQNAGSSANGPDLEVRSYKGRPTVFLNQKPYPLVGFNTFGKAAFDRSMALSYQQGFSIYFISADTADFWKGDRVTTPLAGARSNAFDLDAQAAHVLAGDPNGYLVVRFTPSPPADWPQLHPDEYFVNSEETKGRAPSLASDLYYRQVNEFSAAVVRYCESRPWANRVVAYANFGAVEIEGTSEDAGTGSLYDRSQPMIRYWREFLRKKYVSTEALRAAYGYPTATFETTLPPIDRLRGPAPLVSALLYWQDRKDNQPLRDYLELESELFASRWRDNVAAMQTAANRKVLFLFDGLKQTMLGWNQTGFFDVPASPGERGTGSWNPYYPELMAASGSMHAAQIFSLPHFDGLITPHDYQARGVGGVYEPEGIVDSAVLRGKLFLAEMDTRTYSGTGPKNDIGIARNDAEYAADTWRNLAAGWTRGFTSYWMEFGSGWFDAPGIRKIIGRQVQAMREALEWTHETVPGIAMILDDSSVLETNGTGNYLNEAVMWEQKMGMARAGVPHNIYLFDDLTLDNFPDQRVYYFPNLFRVDGRRMEILRKKVFRDGHVVIWGPGSGISDGDKISAESARRLTGFPFRMIPVNTPRRVLLSNFDHPVTAGLPADLTIGGPLAYGPLLLPLDGTELGAAWVIGGLQNAGLAIKEFGKGATNSGIAGPRGEGDYAAIFTVAVNLPAALWRNIARYAGAHVYSETNDVLVADSSVVALQSLQSGRKRIVLPGRFRVRDVVTGEDYTPAPTQEITFDLKAPQTRVFQLSKP